MAQSSRPILMVLALVIIGTPARAQTTTYHLHTESSSTAGLSQLKTAGPDQAIAPIQSADLKSHGAEDAFLRSFDTQAGVPGLGGIIPANSTLTFTLWMKKTSANGTVFPRVSAGLNWGSGASLCSPTNGTTAISTLQTWYTVTCTTGASDITMNATDRIWVSVGYHMTAGPGNKSMKVELDIEGTSLGATDSRVSVPNAAGPTITSLSPTSGPSNWSVTISGTYFGSSQGTVQFNSTTAPITSWNATTIQTQVPAGMTAGSVTVTVTTSTGRVSSGATFTVIGPPTLTSVTPTIGHVSDSVTIAGNNFMTPQGSSTVSFNGTAAGAASSWSNTSITIQVPSGATSGSLVVTVSGQASNALPFTAIPPPTVTSAVPSSAQVGASVTITGMNFGATQGISTVKFNGTTATSSYWSNTAITAAVPTGATTGNIVVTVANQASNGLSFAVAVAGTIGGTVTRATGGSTISGATVQAMQAGLVKGSATTGTNGTYSIPGLDPGTYELSTSATGFSTEVRQGVTVTSSTTTTVNVTMAVPGSISGRVTQADGVTPIVGAAVTIFSGSTQAATASTNGTGDYAMSNVRSGAYTVRAANVGHRTKEQAATIVENANTVVNLSLDAASAGNVSYVYDELGRLVQVIDQAGDSAIYRYDVLGNITAIERGSTTMVKISEFAPNSGAAGTTVTIYGTGFSSTAGQNTVTFMCGTGCTVNATVTAASATQLTITVPATASTGAITVTTPNGSSTSSSQFTVAALDVPAITSFSPTIGVAGTPVTVSGTNFDTSVANDRTKFNASFAYVSAATSTSLTTSLPTATGSGPITVSTPIGTAVSASDFFVPPPSFAVADVQFAGRLAMGGTQLVTISTATKIGLVTFAATAGQRVSLLGTNGMSGQVLGCDVYASILKPNNSTLVSGTCMESSGFIDATTIPTTGTYTILVDPTDNATGSVTLALYSVTDVTGTITAGGPAVTVTTTAPGQNATLTLSGTGGQRISVFGTNGMTGQILGCDVNVSIVRTRDNLSVAAATCMEGSGFIDATALPTTDTYTILVDPASSATGSLTLTLYTVTDYSGTITPGGPSVTVPITTPGQNGTLTFSGTANQRISLRGTNGTISGQILGCDVNVRIVRTSDNFSVASATCMEGNGFIDATQLPTTDTYSIIVDPVSFATGNLPLTLYTVTDVSGTMTADGAPVTVSITTPGQNGALTFSGTAGQRVSLEGLNGTIIGQIAFACDVNVSIVRVSDSFTVAGATCMEGNGFIDRVNLPTTDSYKVIVDPVSFATGNLTLKLYTVPADVTGSLTINAAATPVSLQTPGQNASFTFTVASSQQVTVRITNNTIAGTSPCVTVSLVGGSNPSSASCASSFNLTQQTLGAGTYTVNIDPYLNSKGSLSVQVTSP